MKIKSFDGCLLWDISSHMTMMCGFSISRRHFGCENVRTILNETWKVANGSLCWVLRMHFEWIDGQLHWKEIVWCKNSASNDQQVHGVHCTKSVWVRYCCSFAKCFLFCTKGNKYKLKTSSFYWRVKNSLKLIKRTIELNRIELNFNNLTCPSFIVECVSYRFQLH